MLLTGLFSASAQSVIPIPKDDKQPVTTRPKTPTDEYVTMYVYTSQGTLAFDFSDSIESLYVILTDETVGTVQTGTVSHAQPSMDVLLPDNGTFTVTCESDNGSVFYTQFSY